MLMFKCLSGESLGVRRACWCLWFVGFHGRHLFAFVDGVTLRSAFLDVAARSHRVLDERHLVLALDGAQQVGGGVAAHSGNQVAELFGVPHGLAIGLAEVAFGAVEVVGHDRLDVALDHGDARRRDVVESDAIAGAGTSGLGVGAHSALQLGLEQIQSAAQDPEHRPGGRLDLVLLAEEQVDQGFENVQRAHELLDGLARVHRVQGLVELLELSAVLDVVRRAVTKLIAAVGADLASLALAVRWLRGRFVVESNWLLLTRGFSGQANGGQRRRGQDRDQQLHFSLEFVQISLDFVPLCPVCSY